MLSSLFVSCAVALAAAAPSGAVPAGAAPAVSPDCNVPATSSSELPDWEDHIDGSVYDYTATMAPETPYNFDYSNLLLGKLFMARPKPEGGSNVSLTFEDALKVIKGIDELSRGVQKIFYLVGWQYDGHDWKYPAFFEFNEDLKRPQDATAADSYRWLREEAKKYNTTISVHVLLGDAYENSPLWEHYLKNGFICRDKDGKPTPLAVFNGQQVYNVNNTAEWKKGALQDRLTKLIELCDLKDAGTVHFDAFFGRPSPYDNLTALQMEETLRKVMRWLRSNGIDLTAEFFHNVERVDPFYGLQACAWWDDRTPYERVSMPKGLADGGNIGRFRRWDKDIFLFGDAYGAETDFNFVDRPGHTWGQAWNEARQGIATQLIPMLYYRQSKPVSYDDKAEKVIYENGIVADWGKRTVTHGDLLLRDHDNTFFPLVQTKDKKPEIMAYSKEGYTDRTWTLPADWRKVSSVKVLPLTENGFGKATTLPVKNGAVTLSLQPNSIVILQKH